jgi:ABC-type multidrug transport system ATPase subunit
VRVPEVQLRSLLGCFLFSGDDVFKPLGVLSGGERNRYALARILVSPANFLLLDEPTNHLDMRAKDVLLEALAGYSGTVIFVSHDRYFIDRLATRVLEIEGGAVTAYEGNYEDYLRRKSALAAPVAAEAPVLHHEKPASIGTTIVIEGGFDEFDGTASSHGPEESPPESHQAKADAGAMRLSRRRRSRASKAPSRIAKTSWLFMSPPPKLSASLSLRRAPLATRRAHRRVGRVDGAVRKHMSWFAAGISRPEQDYSFSSFAGGHQGW